MALTIAIEGKGVIANCDSLTADTGGAGTGTWHELGGGSISLNPDVYLYGSNSIGSQYASKSGWTYFDEKTGLDFTPTTGTETDQFIYIWVNISAGGALDTIANKGLAIRIGSSTADYREYIIGGSDDTNGWSGGWKLFVLDPTKAGSVADTGTFDISSVQYFGLWIDTAASVRADSIWIDQIAVGSGLRVTGSSTVGWKDLVDYCTDYTNRAWGMFQEKEDGIYTIMGKVYIGDSTQTAITDFKDSGRLLKFGLSQYWSGSAWVTSFDIDGAGVTFEDATSFETKYEDGVIVGSESGRSGTTIVGNADQSILINFSGMSNASSYTKCYSSQFINLDGGILWHNNSSSLYYGGTISDSEQFDPKALPIIKNLTIVSYIGTGGSLLWPSGSNVTKVNFIDCDYGVEITQASNQTFDALTFDDAAGNYDVHLNNGGTSIEVAKTNGANPNSYLATGGGTVTFTASFTLTMTNLIEGTQLTIVNSSTRAELQNSIVSVTGTVTYAHSGGTTVDILLMDLDYDPNSSDIFDLTLPNENSSIKFQQADDLNFYNPA